MRRTFRSGVAGAAVALALALLVFPAPAPAGETPLPAEAPAEHAASPAPAAAEHYHPMSFRAFAVQALGFAILAFIVVRGAGPLVARALEGRRARIARTFEDLAGERERIARARAEAEARLADADRLARERIAAAVETGQKLHDELLMEGGAAAANVERKARVEAAIERATLLIELRNEAVRVGFRAAKDVIREAMDRETQDRLVAAFIDDLDRVRPTSRGVRKP